MEQRKVRIGVAALTALYAEIWIPPAGATDYPVPAGTTDTAAKTVSGTDTVTVDAGGKLSVDKKKPAIDWNGASTDLKITNSGTIESTKAGGRAIDATGDANNRSLTLENKKDAIIKSDDDAVRINVNPTGGTISVNNAGTIQSATGQALDFDQAASGAAAIRITNAGTIKADAEDAIRPGQGTTITNSGSIYAGGGAGTKNDGIDFKDNTAGTVNNTDSGSISGARHGVTLGGGGSGSVTVNNAANATITGRNGSGVGSDAGGTVTNYGTIEGAYSGNGTQDGDGDGVDIDYAGTITNYGTIKGSGAGGYDKGGRANNSEGISLGGGTITNSGTISGAKYGIVINNDANPDNSRSGVAATTITNAVGGTIEGKDGYAIRLENKLGTAADNDTIVNKGTIIGNGTIPDPTAVVTLQNGSVDGGSVGTLDGVRYTGTGSARFIRGDGAAIQMGEGDDVLTNSGTITGNTGRAISLEGGNDTLNLVTGSSITGRIDGGTGTDTLNLDKESTGPATGTLANVINFEVLNVKGGTWALTGDHAYANGVTVSAGARLRIGEGATATSLAGNIANDGALSFESAGSCCRVDEATYAGTISGTGSLTKLNTGKLTLTGASTYTGATIVSGGTLTIQNATALGAADGTAATSTTVVDGATLALQGGIAVGNEALSLAGTGVNTGGALRNVSGINSYAGAISLIGTTRIGADAGRLTLSGSITGAPGTGVELDLSGAGDGIVAGDIGTVGTVIKFGAGTWTLTGKSSLGDLLYAFGGALRLEGGGTASSDRGIVGGDTATTASATVTGSGSTWTNRSTLVVGDVNGAGILTVAAGGTVSVGTNGAGTMTLAKGTRSTGTLNLGAAGGETAVAAGSIMASEVHFGAGTGTITFNHTGNPDGSAVAFAPTITGAGSLSQLSGTTILTGANTYTGVTTVSGGTLTLQNATALGAADGTAANGTRVASGATLALQGGIAVGNEALSLAGTGVSDGGALRNVSGDNSYSGAITLTDNSRIAADADRLTLSGSLAASGGGWVLTLGGVGDGRIAGTIGNTIGSLLKDGTGTWTVTGQAALANEVQLSGGTLTIAEGGRLSDSDGFVGHDTGSSGTMTVTGTGSTWTNSAGLVVGFGGTGTLAVQAGGQVSDRNGTVGYFATSSGTATVTGAGSTWSSGDLTVGEGGTGTFTVAEGGLVSVGTNGTGMISVAHQLGSTGTLNIGAAAGQTAATAGTVQAGEVQFGAGTGRLVFNHTGNPDGTALTFAPRITGAGGLSHLAGTTILTGANTYRGTTSISGGLLSAANATALGTSATTVTAGGTLNVNGVTIANALTLSGPGAGGVGALTGTGTAGVSGPITLAGNTAIGGSGSLTLSGAIGDGGNGYGLSKLGTGTAILTAANTYTGTTTVSGGTLSLSGAGTLVSSSGVALATGGTFDISNVTGGSATIAGLSDTAAGQAGTVTLGPKTLTLSNATGSYGGSIVGTGGLTLAGGMQTLTGASTYSGATTVSRGTLTIQNATALGAADGTAATGTTIADHAALALQGGIAVGNEALSIAGFGVNGGGALRSVSGNNSLAGPITLTGNAKIVSDSATLTLTGDIVGVQSPYVVLAGAGDGTVAGGLRNLDSLFKQGGGTWTLSGQSVLGNRTYVWDGALRVAAGGTLANAIGAIYSDSRGSAAVTVTGAGSRWTNTDSLLLGEYGHAALTVAEGGTVTVGTNGTGTLFLAPNGGTTATLNIGAAAGRAPVAAGAVQAAEVAFGDGAGTLMFNHTGNLDGTAVTFAPKITGAGTVSHRAGTTFLTGASTYTGATTVSGGILSAAHAAALGTSAAAVTPGGTLDVSGVTIANPLTLSGTGAGGAGALTGTGTAGVIGPITLAGNATLGGSGTLTVAGTVSDGGAGYGLSKTGTGTAILTAANTYAGGTIVTGGTLALAGGGTLGSTRAATTIAGATSLLDLGGTGQTQAAVSLGQGATLQNGALAAPVASAGGTLAQISGTATLTTTGGTTVSTANTYTGATTVGDGSVLRAGGVGGFSAASAYTLLGSGILDLAGAANTVGALASASPAARVTSSAAGPAVLTVAGPGAGSFAGTIQDGTGPVGLTLAGTTALTLTGSDTYTGATTIGTGATLRLGDGGTRGAIAATSGVTNAGTLVLDRADAVTFAPAIAGSGSLIHAGSGTTVLTGRNTYTGPTTIAAGTLQIDGVLSASEVTVKSGGTLAGSGKIGDPLIEAGGRLAPGSATAIGTLSITGPLTFAGGSFYTVKVTPTANDRTTVTGPATIRGGTVQVLAGSGTYTPALRYTLLSATGGVTGRFTSLQTTSNLAFLTPALSYDATSVALGFAQAAPISSAATTPNQGGVAGALNGAGPTVTTTPAPASASAASTVAPPVSAPRTPTAPPIGASAAPRANATQTEVALDGTTTTTISSSGSTTVVVASPAAQVATAVLNQTAPGAVRALNALSGEIQVSAIAARAQTALAVQGTLLEHLRFGAGSAGDPGLNGAVGQRFAPGTALPAGYAAFTPDEPVTGLVPVRPLAPRYAIWGQALGAFGVTDATRNAARLTGETGGFVLGAETGPGVLGDGLGSGLDGWRVGVAGGYSVTQFDVTARRSAGRIEGSLGAAYASGTLGRVQVRLGTLYGRDALDTRRTVLFPGFSQAISGRAGGSALQSFGEVGYRISGAERYIEPFVGAAVLRLRRDGFAETGGSSALAAFGRTNLIETATAGVQAQAVVADLFGGTGPLLARGLIGYRRLFGEVAPAALLAFRGGSTAFRIVGAPLARDAAVASTGLDWAVAPGTVVGLSYDGQIGARTRDHAIKGSLSYRW